MESSQSFLFHDPKFIFRNAGDIVELFSDKRAKIYFSRKGNTLVSLDKAPFGGFIMEGQASTHDLLSLTAKIDSFSGNHGITNIVIRLFPEIYHPLQHEMIKTALLKSGFLIQFQDIAQVIKILTTGVMPLDIHKKRRLRKAEAAGLVFRELAVDSLAECYQLIVSSRLIKDYPVTMTFEQLFYMFQLFPNAYRLFGLCDNEKILAAAVCIEVTHEIMYCFYIGDHLAHRSISPVTALVNGIYSYCQSHQFKLLDLGISTDKGKLNSGLYNFKKTFGSIASDKLTFSKTL